MGSRSLWLGLLQALLSDECILPSGIDLDIGSASTEGLIAYATRPYRMGTAFSLGKPEILRLRAISFECTYSDIAPDTFTLEPAICAGGRWIVDAVCKEGTVYVLCWDGGDARLNKNRKHLSLEPVARIKCQEHNSGCNRLIVRVQADWPASRALVLVAYSQGTEGVM
jgi:hypothetical protein